MFERIGMTKKGVVSIAVIILFGCVLFVSTGFRTTQIEYEGNTRYTDEEMTNFIFGGKYNVNTLIYYFFTSKKDKAVIPFVQDYEVSVAWPNKLEIKVYEKRLDVYLDFLKNMEYVSVKCDKTGKNHVYDMPICVGGFLSR